MKKYQTPKIEIEEIETADIMASSGYSENETPVVGGGGRPRIASGSGSIAGGSTVTRITGMDNANMFSAGDIFGNK